MTALVAVAGGAVVRSGTRRALESAGTAESFGVFSRAAAAEPPPPEATACLARDVGAGTATFRVVVTRLNVDIRLVGAEVVPVPATTRGALPVDCMFVAAPAGCTLPLLPPAPAA